MKKVLHVSYSLDTGGGPLYISKIVEGISSVGHYVAGNKGSFFSLFKQKLGSGNVFELNGKALFGNIRILRSVCLENNITIVHAHGRGAGLYARLLKLILPRIKVIYTIHGFHPDTLNSLFKLVYVRMEKILLSFTEVVISVSKSERKRFVDAMRTAEGKVHYIPNFISEADIKPQILADNVDRNYVNLLYIGRLSWEKGVDILMDAWRLIEKKNVRLYVVGYGPDESLVKSYSDSDNVVFLGKVENASGMIPSFDAVIIPSRFEGMPFIGLETMIQRTAVICTPSVGLTDLFDKSTSYMAHDFSPTSLKIAIERFVDDFRKSPVEIERKVELSFKKVKEEFSKDNLKRIEEIYNTIQG